MCRRGEMLGSEGDCGIGGKKVSECEIFGDWVEGFVNEKVWCFEGLGVDVEGMG